MPDGPQEEHERWERCQLEARRFAAELAHSTPQPAAAPPGSSRSSPGWRFGHCGIGRRSPAGTSRAEPDPRRRRRSARSCSLPTLAVGIIEESCNLVVPVLVFVAAPRFRRQAWGLLFGVASGLGSRVRVDRLRLIALLLSGGDNARASEWQRRRGCGRCGRGSRAPSRRAYGRAPWRPRSPVSGCGTCLQACRVRA